MFSDGAFYGTPTAKSTYDVIPIGVHWSSLELQTFNDWIPLESIGVEDLTCMLVESIGVRDLVELVDSYRKKTSTRHQ